MRPMTKTNGERYYSYIINCVYDVLDISEEAGPILAHIGEYFKLKAGSVCPPTNYLGTKLHFTRLLNGVAACGVSPSQYVQEATKCCKKHVDKIFKGKYIWFGKAPNPFVMNYDPCTDISTVCTANKVSYFQSLIGVMRWMVEIGRIDIATEISFFSSHMVIPQEVHLEADICVMSYFHLKHNSY